MFALAPLHPRSLAPLLLCLALTASWSQPPEPGPPPGGTYDPYQPLVRQGHLPDHVLQVLQGVMIFRDEITARLPGPVRIKPALVRSPLLSPNHSGEGPSLLLPASPPPVLRGGASVATLPGAVDLHDLVGPILKHAQSAGPVDVQRAQLHAARAALEARKPQGALVIAKQLLEKAKDPGLRYAAQVEVAASHYHMRQPDEVVRLLGELIKLDAPDADAYMWTRYYLGSAFIGQKCWREAILQLRDALEALPEPPCSYWPHVYRLRLLYRIHRCYMNLIDFENGQKYMQQYLAEIKKDTEREARENHAAFSRLVELLQERMDVEGLQEGTVSFGWVPFGIGAKTTFSVCKPWGSDTDITCDLPFVTARVRGARWRAGNLYSQTVVVQVLPEAPRGEFDGQLRLVGKPPVLGSATVAVRGEVR